MPNDYTHQLISLRVHLMPNDHSFIAVISFQENLRQHDQLTDTVVTGTYSWTLAKWITSFLGIPRNS